MDLPIFVDYQGRVVGTTKDSYIKNAYIEQGKDGVKRLKKRPALKFLHDSSMNYGLYYTSTECYGIVTGNPFTLVKVYPTGVSASLGNLTGTNDTDPHRFIFTEPYSASGKPVIVFATRNTAWSTFVYDNNAGTISAIADADYPGPDSGLVSLDGYVFASDGKSIYNSNLGDALTWNTADFLGTQNSGAYINELRIHNNHVVAFTDKNIEFFYNNGNPLGSPLNVRRDLMYSVGSLSPAHTVSGSGSAAYEATTDPFASSDIQGTLIAFAGKNNTSGELGIYLLSNFNVTKISTIYIERILNEPLSSTGGIPARVHLSFLTLKAKQHLLCTIRVDQGSDTFVSYSFLYDFTEGAWIKWDVNSAFNEYGEWVLYDPTLAKRLATSKEAGPIFQDPAGIVYQLDDSLYQDLDPTSTSQAISVQIQTPKISGGSGEHSIDKYNNELYVVADRSGSTNNLQIEFTDDDYQNYVDMGNLDISSASNSLYQLGVFQERAYRLTHSSNSDLRLEAVEAVITGGR